MQSFEAPGGALPSYAHGNYRRDNAFYTAWDAIARDREVFLDWMDKHVLTAQGDMGHARSSHV